MTGAPLWIPAFAGMAKKDQSPRSHGFSSFLQNAPRHSCEGGNPLGITVIHIGVIFLNLPNLPCLGPFFQVHLFKCIVVFYNRQRKLSSSNYLVPDVYEQLIGEGRVKICPENPCHITNTFHGLIRNSTGAPARHHRVSIFRLPPT